MKLGSRRLKELNSGSHHGFRRLHRQLRGLGLGGQSSDQECIGGIGRAMNVWQGSVLRCLHEGISTYVRRGETSLGLGHWTLGIRGSRSEEDRPGDLTSI